MSAAAPWSVKGIDPKAREIAKDLARRSGMTLGEWLNSMIMEDGEGEDVFAGMSRRQPAYPDMSDRGTLRSRRGDDYYGAASEADVNRLTLALDAIAARLESAERNSTVAIQGVDQAVAGLVRRLEEQDERTLGATRRIDEIAEDLREGHRRLRKFEQETAPLNAEMIGKMEVSVAALGSRLYEAEERQRLSVGDLRRQVEDLAKAEPKGASPELLMQVGGRLDAAQARTDEALRGLERSFAELDRRMRDAEGRVEPQGARDAARFEALAESLARKVDDNRSELMRRLDTAETENRFARIEQAVKAVGEQALASEKRAASAVEAMGREVLRIAQNLGGRLQRTEREAQRQAARLNGGLKAELQQSLTDSLTRGLGASLTERIDREAARQARAIDQRLQSADDRHALAIEQLGGEITRISDRLTERIAQSERRSAQALEDIGQRLAERSEKLERRYDRASGEFAERVRLSEERTARLLEEARETLQQRGARKADVAPSMADVFPPLTVEEPDWSSDLTFEAPAPFPAVAPEVVAEAAPSPRLYEVQPKSTPQADDVIETLFISDAEPTSAFEPVEAPETRIDIDFASELRGVAGPGPDYGQSVFDDAEPEGMSASAAAMEAPAVGAPFAGFGGADVADALAATDPARDELSGADFIDPASRHVHETAERVAMSTRGAIDAARAAMNEPVARGRSARRGGKSRLQERLDRQTTRSGSTFKKAVAASVVAVGLTSAGIYGYGRMADEGFLIPDINDLNAASGEPIAALATTPDVGAPMAEQSAEDAARAAELYAKGLEQIDGGAASTGVETLKQAASLGYAPAQLHLAALYHAGDAGLPVNLQEARLWARRAAEGEDVQGMHDYGMYLFDGVGGARNAAEGLRWLEKAANKGLVDSQFNVAHIYERGDTGVVSNRNEAYKWYLIAARGGDQQAQAAVDRLSTSVSAAVRASSREAADQLQKAATTQAVAAPSTAK